MTPQTQLEDEVTTASAPSTPAAAAPGHAPQQNRGPLKWVFAIVLGLFHALALSALFFFSWEALAAFVVLWIFGQNVGIAMGYHRLLTHRGYAVPRWLEYAIATCGTMALQGGPIYWVGAHRLHHQLTDKPGDPHSPRDGKWWSHMGWILHGSLHSETTMLSRYAPDLQNNRFYRWLAVWHWVPITVTGIALLAG